MRFDLWRGFLDLLFPPKCAFCHKILPKDCRKDGICPECMEGLKKTEITSVGKCEFTDGVYSCQAYNGNVRKSIHRFKFGGRQEYSRIYADMMAKRIIGGLGRLDIGLVTYVPTNKSHIRKRGYDHGRLIAKYTAEKLELDEIECFGKCRETKPMYGLSPSQRRANILGAISLTCKKEHIMGKNVLITDDIFTTGASVSECARLLKSAGAGRVYVLTVAKTEK